MTPGTYVDLIKQTLEPLADSVNAKQMRANLRDQFSFLGIPALVRRQALKSLPQMHWSDVELLAVVEMLWSAPEREDRYVAIDLLKQYAKKLKLPDINRMLALAQREPWWETVDGIAGLIGNVIARERKTNLDAHFVMDELLSHSCLWVRRVAIIHQLDWRLETDEKRLFAYAETLAPETDFFIRKAIDWALRDFAKWNPKAVDCFIRKKQHLFFRADP